MNKGQQSVGAIIVVSLLSILSVFGYTLILLGCVDVETNETLSDNVLSDDYVVKVNYTTYIYTNISCINLSKYLDVVRLN